MADTEYSVYIVHCGDDSYYTGISADVERRLKEHENSPRGAKYLRGRGPLQLVFSEVAGDRSEASSLEYRIKRLNRSEKEALIDGSLSLQALRSDQDSAAG
jgi:putative endonuclease